MNDCCLWLHGQLLHHPHDRGDEGLLRLGREYTYPCECPRELPFRRCNNPTGLLRVHVLWTFEVGPGFGVIAPFSGQRP